MTLTVFSLCFFFSISSSAIARRSTECSKPESVEAERGAAKLKTWNEVHIAFKKFNHCDDGAISEGFSESVSHILANKWDTLSDLRRLIASNPAFDAFVLKHIDETAAEDNLKRIEDNTRNRCPHGSSDLCARIRTALK